MLWNSESKHLSCLDEEEGVLWAAPGAPERGGRGVLGSRAVTESGTRQLSRVEIENGLSTGLWNQMGLGSNASSATSWLCDLE